MNEQPAARRNVAGPGSRSKRGRIHRAIPSWRETFLGAPAWGLAMAFSAWYALWLREHDATFHLQSILLLYALGGLVAWPLSLFGGRCMAEGRSIETRFAAYLLCLIAGTIGLTGLLFALDYRLFYSQWHATTGSRIWFYQALFTSASAFYQFLVLGIRLYLPLGALALVLASLGLARRQ
ncbi:hypothetical protein [Sinorhizobium americanum]|uniref:Transmembrane protein n=1 Tax=Sinorhizobium americanum TaxID=194963 RepID=A0A4R2BWE7_9HYPH|nr:hypothetical protein [Sinorhizobium americanum]APG84536.1 hypothetical protein SAMCCGM7_Ch1789 [Sinorhizobium americanum CCGM7]TCN30384.1 hypothetical protein EV184_108260 [Sinorhizobium americanum]